MGRDERDADEEEHQGAPPPRQTSTVLIVLIVVGVCMVLGVCLIGILATLLMPALMKAKQKANATKCSNNLRQIAIASIMYADDKRGYPYFPEDPTDQAVFEALEAGGYLDPEANRLGCPASEELAGYEGFDAPYGVDWPGTLPLVWDAEPHPDGFRNVAFLDGSVSRVSEQELDLLLEQMRQAVERHR